jgi:hypothetical protein|tara:strand:- start:422 stop:679 length:258 start_codon:yes stop_codon:yes gene_type:complete
MASKRNYRDEYDNYHSKAEQRKNRGKRVQAARDMKKAGRHKKGMDVHHKDGNPKNNSLSNLKMASKKTNRSVSPGRPRKKRGKKK